MTNSHTIGSAPSVRTLAVGAGGNERPTLRSEPHYPPGERLLFTGDQADRRGQRAALPHSSRPGGSHGGGPLFSRGVSCTSHNATRSLDGHGCSRRTGPLWGPRTTLWEGARRPCSKDCHEGRSSINFLKRFEQVGRAGNFRENRNENRHAKTKIPTNKSSNKTRLSYSPIYTLNNRLAPPSSPPSHCVVRGPQSDPVRLEQPWPSRDLVAL